MVEHKVLVNIHFKGRPAEQLFLAFFWAPSQFQMLSGCDFIHPITFLSHMSVDILTGIAIKLDWPALTYLTLDGSVRKAVTKQSGLKHWFVYFFFKGLR